MKTIAGVCRDLTVVYLVKYIVKYIWNYVGVREPNTVDLENFVVKSVTYSKISKTFNFVNNLVYEIKKHGI